MILIEKVDTLIHRSYGRVYSRRTGYGKLQHVSHDWIEAYDPPPPNLKEEKKDKIKSDKSTMSKLAFLIGQANRRFRF